MSLQEMVDNVAVFLGFPVLLTLVSLSINTYAYQLSTYGGGTYKVFIFNCSLKAWMGHEMCHSYNTVMTFAMDYR